MVTMPTALFPSEHWQFPNGPASTTRPLNYPCALILFLNAVHIALAFVAVLESSQQLPAYVLMVTAFHAIHDVKDDAPFPPAFVIVQPFCQTVLLNSTTHHHGHPFVEKYVFANLPMLNGSYHDLKYE